MANSWGKSWGKSWGRSWGYVEVELDDELVGKKPGFQKMKPVEWDEKDRMKNEEEEVLLMVQIFTEVCL